jgi:hypothetical protein
LTGSWDAVGTREGGAGGAGRAEEEEPAARSEVERGARARFPGAARARHPWVRSSTVLGDLTDLYERYCEHEARGLLALLPRAGLRSLYSRARSAGEVEGTPHDPIALATEEARKLLPLPPYEVWLEAYLRDRAPFLQALGIAAVPARAEPVLVDVREMGGGWMAELHLSCRGTDWVGFLLFRKSAYSENMYGLRTADIFRGSDPDDLMHRFREFQPATLAAFLRSVTP